MANTIHFQLRGDTATNWEGKNPVLLRNEPGYDITNNRLKMGDGSSAWNDLPYTQPDKSETWLFTLEDGTIAAKKVALCSS